MTRWGTVLLAAGASTRMGMPKQLLALEGRTLLRRAVEAPIGAGCAATVVVLGANAGAIRPELDGLPVCIVENLHWSTGMASSLRTGILALQEAEPAYEALVVMLCDQPFVTSETLRRLVTLHSATGCPIAASDYAGSPGVPALFHRSLGQELLALQGDEGARRILRRHTAHIATIPFPEGAIDLDSMEEYERLREA